MIDHCLDSNYKEIIQTLCPELGTTKPGASLHCCKLPFLRNVITVGFRMPGCLTFDEVMDRANMVPREEIGRMAAAVRPDDVCNMQYTSGTTGFPKGVMLTHYNVVNDGKCIGDRMDLSTADRMMIQVPMFHCFGMVLSMTSCMTHGATLCPMPYFSAKVSLACINQETHHLLQRRADDVHRHVQPPGLQKDRLLLHAHRYHGRLRLPARADAQSRPAGRDAHDRYRQRLRPDGIRPRQHHERLRRPAGSALQYGRLRLPAHRVQDHRPRDRRGGARRRQRRVLLARLQHHEGLLQDARGHRRDRRQGGLAALRRSGLPRRKRLLPHHRAVSRT